MTNSRSGKLGAAVGCGLLAILAIVHFFLEARAWRALDRFADEYKFDKRWPDHLRTARLEPSADLGALMVADAVVMGETGNVKWPDLDEEARDAWFASLETREAELKSALDLALDAEAARPGWHLSYHFVGKLSYLLERRREDLTPLEVDPPWALALKTAARAAPGYDGTPMFLGAAWLESWGRLSGSLRKEAEPVLKLALRSPDFARVGMPVLAEALSLERAVALVPDESESLRAARDAMAAKGAVAEAKLLDDRWLEAERGRRRMDLAILEKKAKIGDTDALRGLCKEFARKHPASDLDDAEGRGQAARLLNIWPPEGARRWLDDRRGQVVRFFLDGREESVQGSALMRSVDAMLGVPDPVKAKAHLLGGDPMTADELARTAASAGALEWTPYFVARGWSLVKEKQPEKVAALLEGVARSARNECDVLLLRREADRLLSDTPGEKLLAEVALEEVRRLPLGISEMGSMFPCLDPDQDFDRSLKLDFESQAPVLVAWGWNGGTSGTFVVDGKQSIRLPLAGWRGRTLLSLRPIAGKLPTLVGTSFDPPLVGAGGR